MPLEFVTWNQFSQNYLPDLEKKPLEASSLYQAMLKNLTDHHPEINLSDSGKMLLKKYAFQKVIKKVDEKTVLTQNEAKKVFTHYHEVIFSLRGELNSEQEFAKIPKATVPKGLARLASLSTTVVHKYIEPQLKIRAQEQIKKADKVNQVVKPFFKADPNLNPQKIITLEMLAKQLAYFNPRNGEKYQIPYEGRLVEYQVEEIPIWMGKNAYGFTPIDPTEKAHPILVFTGTRLGISSRATLATITADFDPRGVGYIAYKSGKAEIEKWLKKVQGNAIITGHSLGGAIARYTAIDHPNLVQGAFTFSSPGIATSFGKKWKKLKQDPAQKRPLIYNFNHIEDRVPTLGQCHVGRNYQVICAVEKTVNQKISAARPIHYKRLFGREVALLCKTHPKQSLSICMQKVLSTIPFLFCLALLYLNRALFGIHSSKPYVSLFGPLRWSIRKLFAEKLAAKYASQAAAAAA